MNESSIKVPEPSFFAPVPEDGVALSWTIGNVKITGIVESQMAFDPAFLAGETKSRGRESDSVARAAQPPSDKFFGPLRRGWLFSRKR